MCVCVLIDFDIYQILLVVNWPKVQINLSNESKGVISLELPYFLVGLLVNISIFCVMHVRSATTMAMVICLCIIGQPYVKFTLNIKSPFIGKQHRGFVQTE